MQAVKWQKTKQKYSRNYVNFIMQKTMSESTDRWNIKVCVLVIVHHVFGGGSMSASRMDHH